MKKIIVTCTLVAASLAFISCENKEDKAKKQIKEIAASTESALKAMKDANPEVAKQIKAAQEQASEAIKNITPEQLAEAQAQAQAAEAMKNITPEQIKAAQEATLEAMKAHTSAEKK